MRRRASGLPNFGLRISRYRAVLRWLGPCLRRSAAVRGLARGSPLWRSRRVGLIGAAGLPKRLRRSLFCPKVTVLGQGSRRSIKEVRVTTLMRAPGIR